MGTEQLTGLGFNEIFTNSISNSAYYDEVVLETSVKMINNLSAELDIMRPLMLHSGLEVIAHNINRKNSDLLLFENGKTYSTGGPAQYNEDKHLGIYATGNVTGASWNQQAVKADYYFVKGICEKILVTAGIGNAVFQQVTEAGFDVAASITVKNKLVGIVGTVSEKTLKTFGIKRPVFYADIYWNVLMDSRSAKKFSYTEVSKYPAVERDLALLLDKAVTYSQIRKAVSGTGIAQLQTVKLFDVFESDKLGAGKKSMAVNFTFSDSNKTLTDKEIDEMMNRIIAACEKQLNAEVRK